MVATVNRQSFHFFHVPKELEVDLPLSLATNTLSTTRCPTFAPSATWKVDTFILGYL